MDELAAKQTHRVHAIALLLNDRFFLQARSRMDALGVVERPRSSVVRASVRSLLGIGTLASPRVGGVLRDKT